MLRNISAAIALTALSISSAFARPPDPAKWQPDGTWLVDFADQQCTASHVYSSGQVSVTLAFRPRPTMPKVNVLIEAPGVIQTFDAENGNVEFGIHDLDVETLSMVRSAKPGHVIYSFSTDRDGLAELATAQRLKVAASKLRLDLPVTGLTGVMKVLDQCVADLLAHWGLSAWDQARLASFPVTEGNIASYIMNDDFPSGALDRGAVGLVEARVTVSPEGKASDCQLVHSSGHDDLDKKTCKVVLDRARFHPALDREGHAMSSPYLFGIRWMIPSY